MTAVADTEEEADVGGLDVALVERGEYKYGLGSGGHG